MRGDDERRTRRERRSEPGRDEEVRVDDVRVEAARGSPGVAREPEVTPRPAAPAVHDRALELVPARDELPLERGDEDPEVGVVRARVHLGDEQDPHAGES